MELTTHNDRGQQGGTEGEDGEFAVEAAVEGDPTTVRDTLIRVSRESVHDSETSDAYNRAREVLFSNLLDLHNSGKLTLSVLHGIELEARQVISEDSNRHQMVKAVARLEAIIALRRSTLTFYLSE